MKKRKCFRNYYESLDKNFKKYFRQSRKSDEPENIHKLRVTIKKIKAFFHLLNYLNEDFHFDKLFHDFKNVFREAGKVRDIHVQLSFIDLIEKEINFPLTAERARLKKNEQRKFTGYKQDFKNKNNLNMDVKKKINSLLKQDLSFDKIKLYLIKQSEDIIERMNNPDPGFGDLHKLRIHLKRYCYNIVVVNDCLLRNNSVKIHIVRLNKLQEKLGSLHDSVSVHDKTKKIRVGKGFSKVGMKPVRLLNARLEKSNATKALEIKGDFHLLIKGFEALKKNLLKSSYHLQFSKGDS